jgi:Lar family restriction alleviation protein
MGKLLPCPFCGSNKIQLSFWGAPYVSCEQCNTEGPTSDADGATRAEKDAEAVRLWNKRAANTDELDSRILDLASMLSDEAESIRALATPPHPKADEGRG